MEKLLVGTIVLIAAVYGIRQLLQKFNTANMNCCTGNCGTCHQPLTSEKEKHRASTEGETQRHDR
ncbi:MAG: FeoB-associated Cys-rich membrane protein [Syntrophotalea acetylenica]|jgi:ferredoxin|uniref:FeoB-associated Cys-rich membrane protein n=1 Tax=Syntrophotalea acetylenica TaxID=29542 RepID=A0A1L3GDK5_SYNAC|nr:FeoB-associated Cys-rich membrane protein [Syntrophotalea acetylenica]APG24041.1 hypothetical protein A7E75_02625 [Syntrophotalea acetylenica]APG44625.1 hypothetical protein A6070_11250 [Syntrophotalea acetylenica]MDD4456291.1 FeoB-associated Cys-rich membrane protein [Syntrophotalea acetylenica]MDY0261942.1 FeoB-associated Cys-rich membrane protein [Syntrophotalea acetylenica]